MLWLARAVRVDIACRLHAASESQPSRARGVGYGVEAITRMRKGLVLVAFLLVVLGAAWWAFFQLYIRPQVDPKSYIFGLAYGLGMYVFMVGVPRVYAYFAHRNWIASPSDWWDRVQIAFGNDWTHRDPRGWDVDWLRVWMVRNKTKGTGGITISVLGFRVQIGLLIDRDEIERFIKAQVAQREAMLQSMPPQVRDAMRSMMSDIPLDHPAELIKGVATQIPTPVPAWGDLEDDDEDPDKGGSDVH